MPAWTLHVCGFRRHYSPATGKRAETANVFCANELEATDTLRELTAVEKPRHDVNRGYLKFSSHCF